MVKPAQNKYWGGSRTTIVYKDLFEKIKLRVQSHPELNYDQISYRLKKEFGAKFGGIINHVRGDKSGLVVVSDIDNVKGLFNKEVDLRIVNGAISKNSYAKFCERLNFLRDNLHSQDPSNVSMNSTIRNILCKNYPQLYQTTCFSWVSGKNVPKLFDDFDSSKLVEDKYSWLLGAALSRGVFLNKSSSGFYYRLLRRKIRNTVFDLIPKYEGSSRSQERVRVSPDFIDVLVLKGALTPSKNVYKKHPINTGNKDAFLAGLFDSRGNLDYSDSEKLIRMSIPLGEYDGFLSLFPYKLPLLVSSHTTKQEKGKTIIEDLESKGYVVHKRVHTNSRVNGNSIMAYILGYVYKSPRIAAKSIKKWFEDILPLSIFPSNTSSIRSSDLISIGHYYNDSKRGYGTKNAREYSKQLRMELDILGGIDMKPLLQTKNNGPAWQ